MKQHRVCVILAAALVLSAGAFAETVERIVAKVNGQIVTLTELNKEVESAMEQLGPAPTPEENEARIAELKQQVLERIIDNMLVLQVAEDRGLRVPSRFFQEWKQNIMKEMNIETDEELERQIHLQGATMADLRKRFEDGLLLQEVRRMEVDSKVSVSDNAMRCGSFRSGRTKRLMALSAEAMAPSCQPGNDDTWSPTMKKQGFFAPSTPVP